MLKQFMDSGEIGEIVHISIRKPHQLSPTSRAPWHFSREQNGGIVVDLLIHDFDLLRWLTSKEISVIHCMKSKTILPQYPQFYDVASVQIQMDNGILAQLYADWHTPEKCWSFGDCRIYVTGTRGNIELRLCGDPAVDKDELFSLTTDKEPFRHVELPAVPINVTQDFLAGIEGEFSIITKKDVYQASQATIQADEHAFINNNFENISLFDISN